MTSQWHPVSTQLLSGERSMDTNKTDGTPRKLTRYDFLKTSTAAAAGTGLALGSLPLLARAETAQGPTLAGGMGYETPWRASDGPYAAWADKHIAVVPGSPA